MCKNDTEYVINVLNDIIKQVSDINILAEYGDNDHYVYLALKDNVFAVNRDGATLLTTRDGKEAVATFYGQIGTIYEDTRDNVGADFSTLREILLSNNEFIRTKLDELGTGTLSKSLSLLDFDGLVTKNILYKQMEFYDKTLCEMGSCPHCNAKPDYPSGLLPESSETSTNSRKPNLSGNFSYSIDNVQKDGSFLFKAEDIQLSTKAAIFDPDKRILLMKDSGGVWWDMPGGHVQDGESVEDGLHREVEEECGLTITSCKQLFIQSLELGEPPVSRPVVFFVASAYGDVTLSEEHSEFMWVAQNELDDYEDLGVFLPIIKDIYQLLDSGDYHDIQKFNPGGGMEVTDLGKPDYDQSGATVFHKTDGPSAEMMNAFNEIPNSGLAQSNFRHSGEDDITETLERIAEHRRHIRIDPPILNKTGYSEAGGVAERNAIFIEPKHDASMSFEAGPIQTTSSAAVVDIPEIPSVKTEAMGGTGIAGDSTGIIGTSGVKPISSTFSPPEYGGSKVKENPAGLGWDSTLAMKQNATDISTGVTSATSFRPQNDVYEESFSQNVHSRKDMIPEQRPIGEGENHLWLGNQPKSEDIIEEPKVAGNTDFNREQYINLSDEIKPFVQKSGDTDLKILTRNAIRKATGGKPLVVAGWGNYNVVDREGHRINPNALRTAVDRFLNSGYANVNIFHSSIQVGVLIPEFTDEDGKRWTTHVNEEGFFAVVRFRTDIEVARKAMAEVLKGTLRGFSLSGNSDPMSRTQICENGHCWQEIQALESIYELTLCQVPMNQGSWITQILQEPDEQSCPECYDKRSGQYDSSMRQI